MSWMMSVPIVVYLVASFFRDSFRYLMAPFLVADIVYCVAISFLAAVTIAFTIVEGNSEWMRLCHTMNLGTFIVTITLSTIYDFFYAKRDLLRTDEADDEK